MKDLKEVYRAVSKDSAETKLLQLEERWGKKYPIVINSWNDNWDNLSAFFKYDHNVRRVIYTTNAVEGLHRMVRKYTKSKGAFSSQNALLKLVYCAYNKVAQKWTTKVQSWPLILSQLEINFPGRVKINSLDTL